MSIVIAVYNCADSIQPCLDSCLQQSYVQKSIIVIDGGSTDGTKELLSGYSDRLDYWISEFDSGIYNAWNKALRIVSSEWVLFLGADDKWDSATSLEKMMALAHYPEVNFVCAKIYKEPYMGRKEHLFGEPWDYSKMKWRMNVGHAGMLHHISLFRNYGFFDDSYRIAGDYAFLLRVGKSIRSAYLPEPVVVMGGGGVSSTNLQTVQKESRRALIESGGIGFFYGWFFFFSFYLKNLLRHITRDR